MSIDDKQQKTLTEALSLIHDKIKRDPERFFKLSPRDEIILEKARKVMQEKGFCLCTRLCKNYGTGPCKES